MQFWNFLKNQVKFGDWIVLMFFTWISISSFFIFYGGKTDKGRQWRIIGRGKILGVFSLAEDKVRIFKGRLGTISVGVRKRKVYIEKVSCGQKICMGMGPIGKVGEVIVCVPNGIMIEILGKVEHMLDGITR